MYLFAGVFFSYAIFEVARLLLTAETAAVFHGGGQLPLLEIFGGRQIIPYIGIGFALSLPKRA